MLRATRVADGATVALKLLAPAIARDQDLQRRFAREAAAGSRVVSPHVVRVLEAGVAGEPYLAMEYVDGHDLEEELRLGGGRLAPERADAVFADVLAGLEAVHAAGLLHRDLKPANVLLDRQGRARLTDFGLVRLVGEETLTRTGMVLGTPLYMAPEQMMAESPSPAWDLYAAAALYLELWTREDLFPGESPAEILRAKQRGPAEAALAGLPLALGGFLRRALAPDPAERPADAAALRRAWVTAREAGWQAPQPSPSTKDMAATVRLAEPVAAGASGQAVAGPGPGRVPAAPLDAGAPPPARRAGLAIAGLAVALASFAFSWGPASPPTPAPSPQAPAERRLDEAGRAVLLALPGRMRGPVPVMYVLEHFQGPSKPEDATSRWEAAVAALRGELGRHEVEVLAAALPGVQLGTDELDALGQAVLTWWVFSRTRAQGLSAQHEYHVVGEALEAAWHRHTGAADVPGVSPWVTSRFPGSDGGRTAHRRRALETLRAAGGDWVVLFGMPEDDPIDPGNIGTLYQPKGYPAFVQGRIRKTTLRGKPFPAAQEGGLGGQVTILVRDLSQDARVIARHNAQEEADPAFETMALPRPPAGALELVVMGNSFDSTSPLELTLVGRRDGLRVPVLMPLPRVPRPEARVEDEPRTVRRVRLAAELVPTGLHTIEVRVRGIQCMGSVIQAATLNSVYWRRDA